jgi:hypothetical protein
MFFRTELRKIEWTSRGWRLQSHCHGGSKMKKPYPKTLNRARIIRLHKSGKKVAEIARLAGYPAGHGNNRVRGLLMKAGAYKAAR